MKKGKVIMALLISVAIIAIASWMLSGAVYLGADSPHSRITAWLLHSAMRHSVRYHAKDILLPPADDSLVKSGFAHYHEMCVVCHGAPGFERSEIGRGLTPPPPDLQEALQKWNSREIYWIVQHGVKMTGMPSFGVTHSSEELNALVSFLQRLPAMSEAEYAGLMNSSELEPDEHEKIMPKQGHVHDKNTKHTGHEK